MKRLDAELAASRARVVGWDVWAQAESDEESVLQAQLADGDGTARVESKAELQALTVGGAVARIEPGFRLVRVQVALQVMTNLDDRTLDDRLENFLCQEQLEQGLLDEERIELRTTSIEVER